MRTVVFPDAADAADQTAHQESRWIDSGELFQSRQEVVIRHDGQDYRLRITRQNKLILTK
ncbi:MAG TPA: hemin uptake protein HemP [Thiobacillaceae bacterium]|nr:hemin uptake protein HemP [Thiobacillaceae bacterium]HNU64181.1 hemin uptake protein HemP [Thiobacillaceae bacterium]